MYNETIEEYKSKLRWIDEKINECIHKENDLMQPSIRLDEELQEEFSKHFFWAMLCGAANWVVIWQIFKYLSIEMGEKGQFAIGCCISFVVSHIVYAIRTRKKRKEQKRIHQERENLTNIRHSLYEDYIAIKARIEEMGKDIE